jgi:hypothetical protein
MKSTYYHGTSADNLDNIIKHGLSANESKLWNVSEDFVYLWCASTVGKCNDCETKEESENRAFQLAFESAQFACSFAKDCRAVVLKIHLDDSEVTADYSSENMENMGAVCINRDILPKEIKEIKISNDLSLLKAYFLCLASSNEFSNIELSGMEKKICNAFKNAEIYPEDVEDMTEWNIVSTRKSLKIA